MTDIAEELRRELSEQMPPPMVKTYFSDMTAVSYNNGELTLCSPIEAKRNIILSRYFTGLTNAAEKVLGEMPVITIVDKAEVRNPTATKRSPYDFDNFVVGKSNEFAYYAAKAVAETPGEERNNPLFIYGGSGLGKTHLLQAIKNYINDTSQEKVILSLATEAFVNELVEAIKFKKTEKFREKYRRADVILIDDIQFLTTREFSQDEFFHTFNDIYSENGQIVMTADRPVRELSAIDERIRTRFEWGLVIDIKPPDIETRMAIIETKAQSVGLILSGDIVHMIATSINNNIRQLEGVVKRLLAERDLMKNQITLEIAKRVIAEFKRENPGLNPTPDMILNEVSKFYSIDIMQITGKRRNAEIVEARQVAMYLIRILTDMPYKNIGEKIFVCTHTTVIHSIERVEELRKAKPVFDNNIKIIIENIRGE